MIFSTVDSSSVSYLPPCYRQHPALHIHNICFNMFLNSTIQHPRLSHLCKYPSTVMSHKTRPIQMIEPVLHLTSTTLTDIIIRPFTLSFILLQLNHSELKFFSSIPVTVTKYKFSSTSRLYHFSLFRDVLSARYFGSLVSSITITLCTI